MKAYIGIKFHPDNRNRSTIELVSQLLASCGLETVCIRRERKSAAPRETAREWDVGVGDSVTGIKGTHSATRAPQG